jgi:hypothetical protein
MTDTQLKELCERLRPWRPSFLVGIGVTVATWPSHGWWAVLYGMCWEGWVGYRVARWLLS